MDTTLTSQHAPLSANRELHILMIALLCGAVFDYLFNDNEAGVSYPIFLFIVYGFMVWALKERRELRFDVSAIMLVPIVMLALTNVLFGSELFRSLNGLVVPFLLLVHMHSCYGHSKRSWYDIRFWFEAAGQALVQTLRHVPRPVVLLLNVLRSRMEASRYRIVLKVGLGLLIATPILIVVVSLLASSDKLFNRIVKELPDFMAKLDIPNLLSHGFVIVFIGAGLFCYVKGLLEPAEGHAKVETGHQSGEADEKLPQLSTFRLDATVTSTVLVAINAVYVLFVAVQFSYLFGAGDSMLPDGVTYAEYAKRGFNELVIVTIINFALLMGVLHGVGKVGQTTVRLLRALLCILTGCTVVMLCSAYYRLSMYEQAYGFTYTRVLVHAFMLLLLVWLALAFRKVFRESVSLSKPYAVVAIAAYVIVNYMNVDAIITKNNIARFEQSGKIDAYYLSRLSDDAVPYLVELYRNNPDIPGLSEGLRRMAGAVSEPTPWQSFNWARHKAIQALQQSDIYLKKE